MVNPLVGVGIGVGLGVGYGALSEYARLGLLYAKWKGTPYEAKHGRIAELLQSILSAEKNSVSGLSSKGAVDTIYKFIDRTLDFAWFIDETMASQLFIQMIQQSIAYAIASSHAGSIGTIGNVYSGSAPLSAVESERVAENVDLLSKGLRGFLSAEVGQNIPTVAFNLMRGGNARLEDNFRSILRQMDSLLDEWNDLSLSYYRHYHSMARERFADAVKMMETATDRAYGLMEQIGNEHLARINEQLDTLEGAKAWFDAGYINDSELANIAVRIGLEVDASYIDYVDHYNAVLEAINTAILDWDTFINQALSDLYDNEGKYATLIRSIFDTLFTEVTDFVKTVVNDCESTLTDICAYRNVAPSVEIKEHIPEVVTAEVAEVEVQQFYYRKWEQVSPYTVIYSALKPRVLAWSTADVEEAVQRVNDLEVVPIAEIDADIVIYTYSKLREVTVKDEGGC